jgi:hypothetical protein
LRLSRRTGRVNTGSVEEVVMTRRVSVLAAVLVAMLAACSWSGIASGGANRDGALIVHADPSVVYSAGRDYCAGEYRSPSSCSTARTEVDGFGSDAILVWFIAVFPRNASPAINAVQFGIATNVSSDAVAAHGPCGSSVLELPDPYFPENYTGTLVSFSTIRETMTPVYWFAVEGTSGNTFGSAVYPGDGRAVFVDDGSPPAEDEVSRFGKVGWGSAGSNECPPDAYEIRSSSWGKVKGDYR